MIIKSLSRKSPSFQQLITYFLAAPGAQVALTRNLPARAQTPEAIAQEFENNHGYLPRRANGNALYHEILALDPQAGGTRAAQVAALTDLAERYLAARAPNQLAFGVIHTDTAHAHIHLMISSNAVLSRRRLWLAKKDFAALQNQLEGQQHALYPQLGTRSVYHRCADKPVPEREQQAIRRSGKPSQRQQLAETLAAYFTQAKSRAALDSYLGKQGLSLYQRGRSVGVMTANGRRWRLASLGLATSFAEAQLRFELLESRLHVLQKGRGHRHRHPPELSR